nr:putative ribonuclease H-like domain-containing protein [Tanacetum cinerariifolium]
MRPFGCPVIILNTLELLGKFDGKAKEGFLVGYSVNSKAFRLFDINSFADSMNYQPVTAGNQANKNVGHQEVNGDIGLKKNVDVGHIELEKVSTQQYIVFPLWSSISSSYKSLDDKARDCIANDGAGKEMVQEPVSEYDQALKNVLERMMNQEKEATEQSDDVRKDTPINTAIASRTFIPLHDSLIPELEDTVEIQTTGIFGNDYDEDDLETNNHSYADESVGAEADFKNMEASNVVYVDDIIFGSTKKSLCDEFEQIMHNRFQMSSMGELSFFLGLQVQQKEDGIFINVDKKPGMIAGLKVEEEIIHDLERLGIEFYVRGQYGYWANLRIEPDLISWIKEAQKEDIEI